MEIAPIMTRVIMICSTDPAGMMFSRTSFAGPMRFLQAVPLPRRSPDK
jgi:hypothetical protein